MMIRSILAAIVAVPALTFGADHIDAPTATADPAADLADFYAFVNPNDPDETIAIVTFNPFATGATQFSNAVVYGFHFENEPGFTIDITCTFSTDQIVTCNGPEDRTVSGPVGEINVNGDFRVFAGLRDDPFFFDLEAFQETLSTGVPAFTDPGVDFLAGTNVLSLVIGIDSEAVSPAPGAKVHFNHKMWVSSERVAGSGLGGGISGSWYNAANPGQGWVIEVVNNPPGSGVGPKNHAVEQFVVYYYAYTDGAQAWFVGNGPDVSGNTASVEIFRTAGAQFGADFNADDVTSESVGTMTFTFDDCDNGTAVFDSTAGDLASFETDIQRLSNISALGCNLFASGQIDREGRAAVNSALIASDRKDPYNFADDPAMWAEMFTDDLVAGLQFADGLDGETGNLLTGDAEALAGVLVDDRLVTYLNIPDCGSYLAVEAAMLGGTEPTECGGRTLEADVVDVTLSAVVAGFEVAVGDGVDENDVPFLDEFPFLAPPHR